MRKFLLGLSLALSAALSTQAQDGSVSTFAGAPWSSVGAANQIVQSAIGPLAYRRGYIYYFNANEEAIYKYGLADQQVSLVRRGGIGSGVTTIEFANDSILVYNSPNACFCLRSINVNSGAVTSYLQFSGQGAGVRPKTFALDTVRQFVYGFIDDNTFHKVDLRTGGDTILPLNTNNRVVFGMGLNPAGNILYMADDGGNIYKYDLVAKSASLIRGATRGTLDITVDPANQYAYFANSDKHVIYRYDIAAGGTSLSIWAGGDNTPGLTNGFRTDARFNNPSGVILLGNTVYIGDRTNGRIRTVINDTVKSVVGSSRLIDGPVAQARFWGTGRIVSNDSSTTFYVTDYNNNAIRRIRDGVVSTFAGEKDGSGSGISGFRNGPVAQARFSQLAGLALTDSVLYLSEYSRNGVRSINLASGIVRQFSTDGRPGSLLVYGDSLLAADGSVIYIYSRATGVRQRFVGTTQGFANGPGKDSAKFNNLQDMVIDGDNLYVADQNNSRVRRINLSTRRVDSYVGNGQDGSFRGHINNIGVNARVHRPTGLAITRGTMIIGRNGTELLVKANMTGTVPTSTHAGVEDETGLRNGLSDQALFNGATYMDYKPGRLYGLVSDGGNNVVRRIDLRINTAPTFTSGGDVVTSPLVSASYTAPWASGITKGNSASFDESRQQLQYTITVDKPTLFVQQPRLDTNGVLAFRTVTTPSAAGRTSDTAVATVRLKDNGGTAFGGVDSVGQVSFRIILNFVTGTKVIVRAEQLRVQPNPAKAGSATLLLSSPGMVSISDVTGRQVWQGRVEGKLILPAMRPGLYLARAQNQGLVYRFVIE